jgi:hypothetical protein
MGQLKKESVKKAKSLPEKVLFAINSSFASKAFGSQLIPTVGTSNALRMPTAFEHLQEIAILNGSLTAGTEHHFHPEPRPSHVLGQRLTHDRK